MIGALPLMPIHKGNADASTLAFILTNKFTDHLPWYRQVQMFKREGVNIADFIGNRSMVKKEPAGNFA